jgi:hypothetical protein
MRKILLFPRAKPELLDPDKHAFWIWRIGFPDIQSTRVIPRLPFGKKDEDDIRLLVVSGYEKSIIRSGLLYLTAYDFTGAPATTTEFLKNFDPWPGYQELRLETIAREGESKLNEAMREGIKYADKTLLDRLHMSVQRHGVYQLHMEMPTANYYLEPAVGR